VSHRRPNLRLKKSPTVFAGKSSQTCGPAKKKVKKFSPSESYAVESRLSDPICLTLHNQGFRRLALSFKLAKGALFP
jgi:hypothetical protein